MRKDAAPKHRKVSLGCYLTSEELKRLHNYAAQLEIGVPDLCSLIIQHELSKPKLNSLKRRYLRKVGKKDGSRMTVWFRNPTIKDLFAAHRHACQIGFDGDAVGTLFRSEPHEQRLRRAIGLAKGFVVESPEQIE